jgi:hypothetical protein
MTSCLERSNYSLEALLGYGSVPLLSPPQIWAGGPRLRLLQRWGTTDLYFKPYIPRNLPAESRHHRTPISVKSPIPLFHRELTHSPPDRVRANCPFHPTKSVILKVRGRVAPSSYTLAVPPRAPRSLTN